MEAPTSHTQSFSSSQKSPPELLLPAGDLEKLKVALAFGADAVYAGVPKYSLRTREIGFRRESLEEAVTYTHRQGKKIYLVMNIYAHNLKVDGFLKELDRVAAWKPDGLIMSDPGLIALALKRHPHIPIHLSTQANTTNWTTVRFWRDLGVRRIILSRELHLDEIAEMHQKVPDIELEAFVHGAICIAYSGRCLISNYLNHRDANQGTCTNSCRWEYKLAWEKGSILDVEKSQSPYESRFPIPDGFTLSEPKHHHEKMPIFEDDFGTYLMNSRDLCAIELLPDLVHAGIVSFKVEGRTKSAWYAALTARSYRRAIDDMWTGKPFNPDHLRDLLTLSSRTYTTGFYTRNPRQYGENFEDGYSAGFRYQVTGILKSYDKSSSMGTFEVKNRIKTGSILELITPQETIPFTLRVMENLKGESLETAHGGAENVRILLPQNPGDYAFLRQKTE
ncbi:U32 family peptidase C-terminal domain-containing protein [Fidelibacter multiformis]|uniref:U32 family peptidase C-terminal domain-containing protein n=1 Tax=Fidelibacter multiformis TaxID=3377529 RepID=UPI0037DDB225